MAGKEISIGGVKVSCPYKPYAAQIQLMHKIIQSLDKSQNCLLESPTGSGKTMALLCSSLAWQKREYAKRQEEETLYNEEMRKRQDECFNDYIAATQREAANGDGHPAGQAGPAEWSPTRSGCNDLDSSRGGSPITSPGVTPAKRSHDTVARSVDFAAHIQPTATSTPTHPLPPASKGRRHLTVSSGAWSDRGDGDDEMWSDDDDFKPPIKRFRHTAPPVPTTPSVPSVSSTPKASSVKNLASNAKTNLPAVGGKGTRLGLDDLKPPRNVPKIFYGTRTHKQIAQIIRELKKTTYNQTIKMCILSSRDVSCIHPSVSKLPNKNEECRKLINPRSFETLASQSDSQELASTRGEGCRFYCGVKDNKNVPAQHLLFRMTGKQLAWDIEDLVRLGQKNRFCPHYFARELLDGADIVFCPYNYLIDPLVRESMDIHLKNQVLVLDEAHNMEDSAREAASFAITLPELRATFAELYVLATQSGQFEFWRACHTEMVVVISKLVHWLTEAAEQPSDNSVFNRKSRIISGTDMAAVLKQCGIVAGNLERFVYYFKETKVELEGDEDAPQVDEQKYQEYLNSRENPARIDDVQNVNSIDSLLTPTLKKLTRLTGFSNKILETITHSLRLYFQDYPNFIDDYKVAILSDMRQVSSVPSSSALPGIWNSSRSSQNRQSLNTEWVASWNLWCLNPAVAFKYIRENVRSIVLTSGTLTPMDSFQSELDVEFTTQFSANHVVSDKQIWVGALGEGPTGCELNGNFRCSSTFEFQDECGRAVEEICKVVSNGVLCFFPSYALLEKMTNRWKSTDQWDQILQHKTIFREPRGSEKVNFNELLDEFNRAINGTAESNGALFLAVCRGKLSEGIDFSDKSARAVISIGIPFPNFGDLQVKSKREYNDRHCSSRELVNGNRWYEIQAFRALNQAFGRCIRHKNDWGAVVIIEDRFVKNHTYANKLSKWASRNLKYYPNFSQSMENLNNFVMEMNVSDELDEATYNNEPCCSAYSEPNVTNVQPNVTSSITEVRPTVIINSRFQPSNKPKGVVFLDSDSD